MSSNYFREGVPLTRQGLFQLVTDEAYRDGRVEDWEQRILQRLAGFLKLTDEDAAAIAAHSLERYQAGELGAARPLDPSALYCQALRYIFSDNELDPLEGHMLRGLREMFGITQEEHESLIRAITRPRRGGPPTPIAGIPVIRSASRPAPTPLPPGLGVPVHDPEALAMDDDEVEDLVREAEGLALEAEGRSPLDLSRARALLARAAAVFVDRSDERPTALMALEALIPLVATRGALPEAEATLTRLVAEDDGWPPWPEAYRRILEAMLDHVLDAGEAHALLPTLWMAGRLARGGPDVSYTWEARGSLLNRAARRMAAEEQWKLHAEIVDAFGKAPPQAMPSTAPFWAATLADWMETPAHGAAIVEPMRLLTRFEALAPFRAAAGVRSAEARFLAQGITALVSRGSADQHTVGRLLESLHGLEAGWPEDAVVARWLCTAAVAAGDFWASSEADDALRSLLLRLQDVARRFPDALDVTLEAARAALTAGTALTALRLRRGEATPGEADALDEAARTLEVTCGLRPEDGAVADCRARFERITDRPVRAVGAPPRRIHPDLEDFRRAFDRMQLSLDHEESMGRILAVVGYGGVLPRVQDEGPDVIARDERYFLDLVDEVAGQVRVDRSGFWNIYKYQLVLTLTTLAEQAPPAVAVEARRVRTGLRVAGA